MFPYVCAYLWIACSFFLFPLDIKIYYVSFQNTFIAFYILLSKRCIVAKRLIRQRHAKASRKNTKGATKEDSVYREKEGVTSAHSSYDSFYPTYNIFVFRTTDVCSRAS